jgi:hypothetical protein
VGVWLSDGDLQLRSQVQVLPTLVFESEDELVGLVQRLGLHGVLQLVLRVRCGQTLLPILLLL